jgi:hypothetical protein
MKKNWKMIKLSLAFLVLDVMVLFMVYYRFMLTPEKYLLVGALTVAFAAIIGVVIGYNVCPNKSVWHLYDLMPCNFQIMNVIETGKDVTQVKLSLKSMKGEPVFLVDIDNYYFIGSGELPHPNHTYHWNGKKLTFPQPTISREETSGA